VVASSTLFFCAAFYLSGKADNVIARFTIVDRGFVITDFAKCKGFGEIAPIPFAFFTLILPIHLPTNSSLISENKLSNTKSEQTWDIRNL
jgi:hypothetical protein